MTILASRNPHTSVASAPDAAANAALPADRCRTSVSELRSWPVYLPTPLIDARGLAARVGVSRLWIKDEGNRQPLQSFKALGAAYALGEYIRDHVEAQSGSRPDYQAIWAGVYKEAAAQVHACAATDGNHGRSLAWGAKELGARCSIYLPAGVPEARAAAIEEFSATVTRVEGNYEDTVARVLADSARHGMVMLQDTSFPGYIKHCQRIMQGYTLLAEEIVDSLRDDEIPTHLFVQVGCGGLAAAMAMVMWRRYGSQRPRLVTIEPVVADSLRRSLLTGATEVVGGEHNTMMVGMACGEVSMLAWDILRSATHSAVAIDDAPAAQAMRLAAQGIAGDVSVEMGETGAAGLAVMIEAASDGGVRATLELDRDSRVLIVNTEAAIDRQLYQRILAEA